MTPNDHLQSTDSNSKSASRWQLVVLALLVSALVLSAAAGGVGAIQNETNDTNQTEPAPYYENASPEQVDNESWTAGNEDPTVSNITTYIARVGTFVIGSDPTDANAPTGPLIVGLMVLGAVLSVTVGTNMGIVSGAVLAILSLAGVSAVGIFPAWFYAVGLFGVGLMLASSFKRVVA